MKFIVEDNITLYETVFEEDEAFGRKAISKQLSDLVGRIETPLVIALDDKWGTGKTYFLKRWVGAHTKQNDGQGITVYFDAFAHDYLSDPLVSLISAFEDRIPKDKKEDIATRIKTAGAKLAKPALNIGLSLLTFGAQKQVGEIGDALLEAASGETQKAIDQLWVEEASRRNAIEDFKQALSDLVANGPSHIVIVVDELDRCRPDYALSVLEVIKHFFAVPKVHFILGVNGEALENSVKARYGAGIDAEAYLRKFIHAAFALPRKIGPRSEVSVISRFCDELMTNLALSSDVAKLIKSYLEYVSDANNVSLRDVETIFANVALLPEAATKQDTLHGFKQLTAFLIVVSVIQPAFYRKCAFGKASLDELRRFLGADDTKVRPSNDVQGTTHYKPDLSYKLGVIAACCATERWVDEDSDLVKRDYISLFRHNAPNDALRIVRDDWVSLIKANLG